MKLWETLPLRIRWDKSGYLISEDTAVLLHCHRSNDEKDQNVDGVE